MSSKVRKLESLLTLDFDAIVEGARTVAGRTGRAAFREAITRLRATTDPLDRLKLLLFSQTLLAFLPDGSLPQNLTDQAADELAVTVTSSSDTDEQKRSALTALALLLLKAKDITGYASTRIQDAVVAAQRSTDTEISGFASRAFARKDNRERRARISRRKRPQVLLIHGRDEHEHVFLQLQTLVRDKWGLAPIELRSQPARGRTLLEHFEEQFKEALAAIVILTPDDVANVGGSRGVARSNVLFELGWAYGRLGRSRVFVLVRKNTQLPSELTHIKQIAFIDDVSEVGAQLSAELELIALPADMRESA